MTDTDSPLASALGVILAEDQAQSDIEKKKSIAASLPTEVKANNDAEFARETIYSMIGKSNDAITDLLTIAKQTMSARHFEVLAQMVHENGVLAEKLLKIHADHQTVQNNQINLVRNQGGVDASPGSNVQIQNAVFVGTTSDLLKMVKSTQDKQIIEMQPLESEESGELAVNTTINKE